jgi:putative transposase
MRTAYRRRAYPDDAQQRVLARTFGCVRVVWNRTLAARQQRYATQRKNTSYAQTDRALTQMKKDPGLAFLSEVSSVPLQQALRHQHAAFAAFYAKRARYPRFKSRRSRQCAHYTRSAFTMRGGALRLAKMDAPLRFVWSWPDVDLASLDPATVGVAREPDGRWYVTFMTDADAPVPLPQAGRAVGVDLGVTDFATTSEGERIANPRHLARRARSLARCQRRLARAISDCGWGEFRRQLEYKCQRHGRSLVVIDRWYPSSKTCSACGHLLAELYLSARHWVCPSCGARHDRDINAAKNILAAGLAVARGSPGDACGAGVRHSGSSRVRPAVNQEPRPATAGIPTP